MPDMPTAGEIPPPENMFETLTDDELYNLEERLYCAYDKARYFYPYSGLVKDLREVWKDTDREQERRGLPV